MKHASTVRLVVRDETDKKGKHIKIEYWFGYDKWCGWKGPERKKDRATAVDDGDNHRHYPTGY